MDYLTWTLVALAVTLLFFKYKKTRHYFKPWGIPQPFELPFLGVFGPSMIKGEHGSHKLNYLYNLNKEAKYIGCHMFGNKLIILRDAELIKSILVKNFEHFGARRSFVDGKCDPLFGKNLAFINGDHWRDVRTLLSPAFTSSKLRGMYVLMLQCAENFAEQFLKLNGDKEEVDTKDAFTRYANDVIGTCAFGIETDSLKDPQNEFFVTGNRCSNFNKIPFTKVIFMSAFKSLSRLLGLRLISKEDTDYFINIIKMTIKTREDNNITRPDMLQMLMESRDTKSEEDLLDITAQAFIFFLGGFESTASQMCLMANELAINQEVQRKLQAEIDQVMEESNGKPSYDTINNKMPYMDAVFSETMRLYPVSNIIRVCTKDFELPPALPNAKPYMVKENEEVWIPNSAIHLDPNYYEDPEKFNPDRFFNKKITLTDVNFLGFGMGPRACIGNRFAILEIKVLLMHVLAKCDLYLCKKSPYPFEHYKFSFVPTAKNGFWLKIRPRNKNL